MGKMMEGGPPPPAPAPWATDALRPALCKNSKGNKGVTFPLRVLLCGTAGYRMTRTQRGDTAGMVTFGELSLLLAIDASGESS